MSYQILKILLRPMKPPQRTDTVQFTTKGQIVIPAKFRREFQIEEGTRATIASTPEGILLRPITRAYIKSLRGLLKGRGVMKTLMTDRKRERSQ